MLFSLLPVPPLLFKIKNNNQKTKQKEKKHKKLSYWNILKLKAILYF